MPKAKAITPNRHFHTTIPEDLMTRLDLLLWSDLEGRVPYGGYQSFLISRIKEFIEWRKLDLSPFLNSSPGSLTVTGTPEAIARLSEHLAKGN